MKMDGSSKITFTIFTFVLHINQMADHTDTPDTKVVIGKSRDCLEPSSAKDKYLKYDSKLSASPAHSVPSSLSSWL